VLWDRHRLVESIRIIARELAVELPKNVHLSPEGVSKINAWIAANRRKYFSETTDTWFWVDNLHLQVRSQRLFF
jgi:hypothetical protein